MVIGVLSDTHIDKKEKSLLPAITESFQEVDLIVHAGDLTSLSVIECLREIAPVEAVCGNMDPIDVKSALPQKKMLRIEGLYIGLIHGWGPPWGIRKRIRTEFEKVDAIIYGHSHQHFAGCEDGIYFFNPGAASKHPFGKRPTCGRLIIGETIQSEIISL